MVADQTSPRQPRNTRRYRTIEPGGIELRLLAEDECRFLAEFGPGASKRLLEPVSLAVSSVADMPPPD